MHRFLIVAAGFGTVGVRAKQVGRRLRYSTGRFSSRYEPEFAARSRAWTPPDDRTAARPRGGEGAFRQPARDGRQTGGDRAGTPGRSGTKELRLIEYERIPPACS